MSLKLPSRSPRRSLSGCETARRVTQALRSSNQSSTCCKGQARRLPIAVDSFIEQHVVAKLKASTAGEYRRLIRLYLPENLRSRPLIEVQRADISRVHLMLRHKHFQANRLVAVFSKFFNWAEKHGLRPDGTNPCRHIENYRERKRERFLSEEEFEKLGRAIADAEREGTTTSWIIAAIRLPILLAPASAKSARCVGLRSIFRAACSAPRQQDGREDDPAQ